MVQLGLIQLTSYHLYSVSRVEYFHGDLQRKFYVNFCLYATCSVPHKMVKTINCTSPRYGILSVSITKTGRLILFFFFNSNSGGWSPTGSSLHVVHQLAYYVCPGWFWGWRLWWNDDWQGESKYSEKTCPSATSSATNRTLSEQARTQTAAVGSRRLTAWAMARP
jgi:hypothetical protein